MTNKVRTQSSPGPCWETLPVLQDTPEASDVEDTDTVELELLGAPRKRKEQAIDNSNNIKRARYGASQDRRGSKEFNPPSGIQVSSRKHPSPSITRTGRGIEVHSVPESSKRTGNGADGIAGRNSGHITGVVSDRRDAASVTNPGQTISRPDIARKKTARKYASNVFKRPESLSVTSAMTRPIPRTREERKRQNSTSSSSDSLPYSPTAPVRILNGDKIVDKSARKAGQPIKSSQPSGPRKSAVPRRTPEVIDITSDGEPESISQAGKPAPRNVLVIGSCDESTPQHRNNAKVSSFSYRPAPTTHQVIEILDSDEEPISPSKIGNIGKDISLPQDIQDQTMEELDRLSLLAEQSPQDDALVPPPETSSEDSESNVHSVRESSFDPADGETEYLSPPITSINDNGNVDMDIDPIVPAFQEETGSHLRQNIRVMSKTSDFEQTQTNVLPTSQHSVSPPNGIRISIPRSLSSKSMTTSKPVENGALGIQTISELPTRQAQKSPPVHAVRFDFTDPRRKRLSHDEVSPHRTLVAKRNHSGRNLSLPSVPVSEFPTSNALFNELQLVENHNKTESDVPGLSSGMNLADAIMKASQANNRTQVRDYSRTDTVPETAGKPINRGEGIKEAIEKSQLFMRMVRKSGTLDPRQKNKQQSDIRAMERESATDLHSVQNQLDQITGDPIVELGSPANFRQSSSEPESLTLPDIRQQHAPSLGSSLAISGNTDQSNSESTNTKDIPALESDDELEYIDESDVVRELANIDITNQPASNEVVNGRPNDFEPTSKDVVQSANGSITRLSSPDRMDVLDTMTDGEEIISPPTFPSSRTSIVREMTHSQIRPTIRVEGFTILNWREFRQDLSNFPPSYYLAQDLPHTLQDHINHMSEWTRSLPDMRTVFTAAIQENTALDEPDAPPIQVENVVDYEPVPPWEFHYSNQMWHGEGVPLPDMKRLVSCDCIGRCDPRSKTCACVRRQQEAFGDPNADFAYDNRGRLKEIGFPIFECNDLCGCDEDCRNRVVQHGRTCMISIKKTANKGWGVFADQKKIYKGTFIGIYAGEIITEEAGEERGFKYNKLGKTYLFDIDFHHLRKDHKDWSSKYTVDAYHTGNFTRFLNHSCDPNCTLNPCYINESNIDKPLLTVFAKCDIEPGEELCFSYCGDPDDDEDAMNASDDTGDSKYDAVYAKCYCGAKNCKGRLFG